MGQIEDLRAFVQIVEQESIGKAAEHARMAKSAMSRKLRLLEERLQCELIIRTTRQWALSDAGRLYYDRAVNVLSALDEADAEIRNEEREISGEIRLSVPLHFGTNVLMPHLLDFSVEHGGIHLSVDFTDRLVDLIGERYDLAIRISHLADSSLIARKIHQSRRLFCASPAYLDSHPSIRRPEDLKAHSILHVSQAKRFTWEFSSPGGKPIQIALKAKHNFSNGDALLAAAERGLGVIRIPDFLAKPLLAEGRLSHILADFEPEPLGIYTVYPASRHMPRRLRVLIDFLVDRLTSKPLKVNPAP